MRFMNGRLFSQTSIVLRFTPSLNAVGSVTLATIVPFVVTGDEVVEPLDVPLADPQAASKQKNGAAPSDLTKFINFPSRVAAEMFEKL